MALRKKIAGQYYYFDSIFSLRDRDRAYSQAAKLRQVGNKARVVKTKDSYEVWVR